MEVESHLKFPVRQHMERRGFQVWYEVPFMGKVIDVVCYKSPRAIVSVEAKIHGFDLAIYQASLYLIWSDYSYVAIPKAARVTQERYDLLRREGLGLMRANGGRRPSVTEDVRPRRSAQLLASRKRDLIQVLISTKNGR